jgi:NAD(P)-dependent dehydrogenase (short-subunit alcohol dehydrogenase family)
MVMASNTTKRIVLVGADGDFSLRLSQLYGGDMVDLTMVDLSKQSLEDAAAACAIHPIDVLIFADDLTANQDFANYGDAELRELLYRLTYAPFKLATLLRPAVAAAEGHIVLYSRTSALMDRVQDGGRPADRPFRAAAHALWKCLQVEWRDDNIQLLIVAVDDPSMLCSKSSLLIGDASQSPAPLIVDANDVALPW